MKCIDCTEYPCWVINYKDYCRIVSENDPKDPDFWVREALTNHLLSVEKLENQYVYMFRIEYHDVVLSEGTEFDVMVKFSDSICIYKRDDFFNSFRITER